MPDAAAVLQRHVGALPPDGTAQPAQPVRWRPQWMQTGPVVYLTIAVFAVMLTYYSTERGDTIGANRSPFVLLIYGVPLLLVAECYARNALILRRWAPWAVVAFFWYIGLGIIDARGFHKEMYFCGAALLTAMVKFQTKPWVLLVLSGVGMMTLFGLILFKGLPLNALFAAFSVRAVQVDLENAIGLILGLVILSAYFHRKPVAAGSALFLMLVFSKRASLVGVLFVIFIDIAMSISRTGNRQRLRGTITFIVVSVCAAIGVNAVAFYETASTLLWRMWGIAVSATYLSTGRYSSLLAFERYEDKHTSFIQLIFGHGIGHSTKSLEYVLSASFRRNYPLLHDDWLRIVSDFGYIGIAIAVVGFTKVGAGSRLGAMLVIYTSVLFITDNVFSYLTYWFTFLLCLNIYVDRRRPQRILHPVSA